MAVPFCYISGAITIAAQQDEDVPTISNPCPTASEPDPEPHGLLASGPSGSTAPSPGTPPLPVSSLPDIPWVGTPLVGHPFSDLLTISSQNKWDHTPSSSLDHHHTKRTHVWSPEVEVGVEPSPTGGNQDTPELVLETGPGPSSEQGNVSPFQPLQGHHWSGRWNHGRKSKEYQGSSFF